MVATKYLMAYATMTVILWMAPMGMAGNCLSVAVILMWHFVTSQNPPTV